MKLKQLFHRKNFVHSLCCHNVISWRLRHFYWIVLRVNQIYVKIFRHKLNKLEILEFWLLNHPQQSKGSRLKLDERSSTKAVFQLLRAFTASEGFMYETCFDIMFVETVDNSDKNYFTINQKRDLQLPPFAQQLS